MIKDMDIHLFASGTHYEIYNKLGANPLKVNNVDGTYFAVWAPNAKAVSVVGDFNNWDRAKTPMSAIASSGIWAAFVPNVGNYVKYKFEISTQAGDILQKSDPYANFAEMRPANASIVYDIGGYKWKDSKWVAKRKRKTPLSGPINIYELHPGSWSRADDGSFLGWAELGQNLIPYIVDMGYTHIELMPVMEHPFDGSWGYQVTGFFAPSSRFGPPIEFMAFIDNCHQNDIGVILDWVPAHFPKDAHGLACFDGTHLYEHEDPRLGEHPDWGTLIFNYGRNEVKNFLISNAFFWLDKYHIDGLRVDAVASMLYLDYGRSDWLPNKYGGRENIDAVEFIKHMNSIISQRHKNILMIAEESTTWEGVTEPVECGGLGFDMKWNMGWMNDFLSYMSRDSIYRKHHHNQLTFSMMYAYSEKYILPLSHDEVVHGKKSLVDKMPGDIWQKLANLRTLYGFKMGHPGKKLLFMGGEFAQFREWTEAAALEWFLADKYEHHRQLQNFVQDINHLYVKEKALWQKDFEPEGFKWINCEDAERSIVSFYRKTGKHNYLIFVCNFTPVPDENYRVGLPKKGKYAEILNSDDIKYGGSGVVNSGSLAAQKHLCDGLEYSLPLKLPPLAVIILKPI